MTAALSRAVDVLDGALAACAGPLLDLADDARRRAAMADPVYAHRARQREGAPRCLDDLVADCETEDAVGPHPWWEPAVRVMAGRPATRTVRLVRHAGQRLVRGWDDSATWSLDGHLTRTLGAQLIHLADTTHGWPAGPDFPAFEDWTAALREHGRALLAYGPVWDDPADDVEAYLAREAARIGAAQDALRWVAEHLPSLWD